MTAPLGSRGGRVRIARGLVVAGVARAERPRDLAECRVLVGREGWIDRFPCGGGLREGERRRHDRCGRGGIGHREGRRFQEAWRVHRPDRPIGLGRPRVLMPRCGRDRVGTGCRRHRGRRLRQGRIRYAADHAEPAETRKTRIAPPERGTRQLHRDRTVAEIEAGRRGAKGPALGKRRDHRFGTAERAPVRETLPVPSDEAGKTRGSAQRGERARRVAAPDEAVAGLQAGRSLWDGLGLRGGRHRAAIGRPCRAHAGEGDRRRRHHEEQRRAVLRGVTCEQAQGRRRDPARIEAQAHEPRRDLARTGPADLPGKIGPPGRGGGGERGGQRNRCRRGVHDPPVFRIDHEMHAVGRVQCGREVRLARPGRERRRERRPDRLLRQWRPRLQHRQPRNPLRNPTDGPSRAGKHV